MLVLLVGTKMRRGVRGPGDGSNAGSRTLKVASKTIRKRFVLANSRNGADVYLMTMRMTMCTMCSVIVIVRGRVCVGVWVRPEVSERERHQDTKGHQW